MRLDESSLRTWGRSIGASVTAPAVFTLSGPLGAGKSVLARAIGEGAGVDRHMPSPTYNLLLRYPAAGGREIVHLDLYRIGDADEVWELGWSELGGPGEVVLIEWPERAAELLPSDRWAIDISVPEDAADLRDIRVEQVGAPGPIPLPPSIGDG